VHAGRNSYASGDLWRVRTNQSRIYQSLAIYWAHHTAGEINFRNVKDAWSALFPDLRFTFASSTAVTHCWIIAASFTDLVRREAEVKLACSGNRIQNPWRERRRPLPFSITDNNYKYTIRNYVYHSIVHIFIGPERDTAISGHRSYTYAMCTSATAD